MGCCATTWDKEDEEEGQEGFPEEVTQELNLEGGVGAMEVDAAGKDYPRKETASAEVCSHMRDGVSEVL